jgi:hypothetical protein
VEKNFSEEDEMLKKERKEIEQATVGCFVPFGYISIH